MGPRERQAMRSRREHLVGYPRRVRFAAVLLSLASVAVSASAGAATLSAPERGTHASVHLVHAPEFEETVASQESGATGGFSAFDQADAFLAPSIGTSRSWLVSRIAVGRASARGDVASHLHLPEDGRYATAPADVFFEVEIEVDTPEPFRIEGHVDAVAFGADAFAAVELIDLDGAGVVFEAQAGPRSFAAFDEQGVLPQGRYRLTAFALSYGAVTGAPAPAGGAFEPAAIASFAAILTVPEPRLELGLGCGLLVLAVWRRLCCSGARR